MAIAIDPLALGHFVPMMKQALPIVYHRANATATGSLQSAWSVSCNNSCQYFMHGIKTIVQ
jgi:hypothetical protein